MRPPRCRVCGEEGYGHLCRGVELMQLRERVREAAERLKPTKELIEKAEAKVQAVLKPRKPRPPKPKKIVARKEDGSFDKMAYQREYMRRWRKKKKGKA